MKRDPNSPDPIAIFPDAKMYVENGVWYIRVNLPNRKQPERSTRVKYIPNDQACISRATTRATEIYRDLHQKQNAGQPLTNTTIAKLAEEHLATARKAYEINKRLKEQGLPPTEEVIEGRGYWDHVTYIHHKRVIRGYITHRKITDKQKIKEPWKRFYDEPKNNKSVELITANDISKWLDWKRGIFALEEHPKKTGSTIAKQHIVMRHIFKLARRKGLILQIPFIPDPKTNLGDQARPEFSPKQWNHLLNYARNKMGERKSSNEKFGYMWYLYLLTLEHTGCRPWVGKNNAIKLEHIRFGKDNKKRTTCNIWRNDKIGNASWIAADRYWAERIYPRIIDFHEQNNIETEWLFAHWQSVGIVERNGKKQGYMKGDCITSFEGQMQTYLKRQGLVHKGMPSNERLCHYSIRHRYSNKRIRENPEMPITVLASQMRSSVPMLTKVYQHHDADRDYFQRIAGSIAPDDSVDIFDENGFLRSTKRNSDIHVIAYYQSDKLRTEKPDISWEDYLMQMEEPDASQN